MGSNPIPGAKKHDQRLNSRFSTSTDADSLFYGAKSLFNYRFKFWGYLILSGVSLDFLPHFGHIVLFLRVMMLGSRLGKEHRKEGRVQKTVLSFINPKYMTQLRQKANN